VLWRFKRSVERALRVVFAVPSCCARGEDWTADGTALKEMVLVDVDVEVVVDNGVAVLMA
jgi:hypothetical protein